MDEKLYQDLYNLRQNLKQRSKNDTGRMALVCNDEALEAIAEMCPRKLDNLKGIPGVGNTFIENYGQAFIDIVCNHVTVATEKTVHMDDKVTSTLKELEKKLVSINRRNRLLYMPKLSSKYSFDLALTEQENPLDSLLTNRSILLADLGTDNGDGTEARKYKSIVSLLREVNKDLREKGQNDLYIGYPFVIGRIPGESFDIRCPLMLFPVEAERTPVNISVKLDDTRDILYNSTLILAFYKFNNINRPLPVCTLDTDTVNAEQIINNLLAFYSDNGINIQDTDSTITRFTEYKADEFPKFREGEMLVEHSIVMGKYPVCSSSIQKDFDHILDKGCVNNLLNELLLDVNDFDYEADGYQRKDLDVCCESSALSENSITYINELDSSQENVLATIQNTDKLVIQGPPGTGKSQTITSLIAEFANADKTVLLVSEKKTALDVVYSRLGELSKYALLIDDVGNKELFYQQLSKMVFLGDQSESSQMNLDRTADDIDKKITRLENIASKLYQPDTFGVEPYKIYLENKRLDFSNQTMRDRFAKIHNAVSSEMMQLSYDLLVQIRDKFNDQDLLNQLESYNNYNKEIPWITSTRHGISELDLMSFSTDLDTLDQDYKEYTKQSFIKRIFTFGKLKKSAKEIAEKLLCKPDKNMIQMFIKNQSSIRSVLEHYISYDTSRSLYRQLTAEELKYFELLLFSKGVYNSSLLEVNKEIYNHILREHISIFETANKQILEDINNYPAIVRAISENISKKKDLTRKRLEHILSQSMCDITNAKRKGEIQRVIESKRKWSVNKFINKFSFEIFKGIDIWLLTPEVVSEIIPLDTGVFDLVIFDEASQMYVEKGLPAIYRAKKVIIAGDHKQLRPSSLGNGRLELDEDDLPEDMEITAALEEESLLDLARFKYQDVMLNFHYRAKYEELIAFSNYAFYKGRLHVSPNVEQPASPPIEVHEMSKAIWADRSNMVEAEYIIDLLKNILRNRKENETIGIITFNSNQRELIMDLMDEQCALDSEFATIIRAETNRKRDGEDIGLFIKNIESVQGDERDIIIFSIGYAKNENGRLIRNFGWLNQKGGENRLNVAISRAKKKIHIVTSFSPQELQVEDTKNEGPRILKKYLQYAKAISDGDRNTAEEILFSFTSDSEPEHSVEKDSEFENQVRNALYERLIPQGYTVDSNVGIGGYTIDLAIKKEERYVLGVEFDIKTFKRSSSARERDYHRQKYLKSRGWNMHRIWCIDWWKDPVKEINKICELAGIKEITD